LHIAAMGIPELGTSVTPTVAAAGTTTNTVSARAFLNVDVRARTVIEQERVHAAMHALTATLPGARLTVLGGPNRPPMEASSGAALFVRAVLLGRELGLGELVQTTVGGGSDGNFTAGVGVPTLDGLGAVGGGAHADDEHILLDQLVPRTALLVALLQDLLAGSRPNSAPARVAAGRELPG